MEKYVAATTATAAKAEFLCGITTPCGMNILLYTIPISQATKNGKKTNPAVFSQIS
jgi:hypothetical protein